MSARKTPNTDIENATNELGLAKLTLDNVHPEQFDKETLRAFIAMCNAAKLSAVKSLQVLDRDSKQPESPGMKPSVAIYHLLEHSPTVDNPVLQYAIDVAVKSLQKDA